MLELQADDTSHIFAAPPWLQRAGETSWYAICVAVAALGVLWLLGSLKFIVVPLILSVVLAVLFEPAVTFMARHKISRGAGSAIIVLILVAIGVVLAVFLVSSVVQSIPAIQEAAESAISTVDTWLGDNGISSGLESATTVTGATTTAVHALLSGAIAGIGALAGLLAGSFLALFILLFLMTDLPRFTKALIGVLPLPAQAAETVVDDFASSIRGYYRAVTIVGAVNGVVIAIVAVVLNVPLAGAIAVITFVTSYIPVFGAFIAGGIAALIAYGSGGIVPALIMITVSVLYNNVASNVFQPLASGRTLNLHPLMVLVVTTAGGLLFGIIGAMLAAPIAGGIMTVRRDFREARERAPSSNAEPPGESGLDPAPEPAT